MLAVVEEEVRQDICYLVEVAEADKPRHRGMHDAVATAHRRADLHQETFVGKSAPHMAGAKLAEIHPIPPDGVRVEVGNRHFVDDAVVSRLGALVANHAFDRLTRTMVVALAVSAVGTLEHVRTDIDRADSTLRARNLDDNEPFAVNLDGID